MILASADSNIAVAPIARPYDSRTRSVTLPEECGIRTAMKQVRSGAQWIGPKRVHGDAYLHKIWAAKTAKPTEYLKSAALATIVASRIQGAKGDALRDDQFARNQERR